MGVYIPTDIYAHNKLPDRDKTHMTKIKKEIIEETVVETVEPIVKEKVEEKPVETVESAEKAAFRTLIENYKISNPVKYEGKKEALEKQLNEIK